MGPWGREGGERWDWGEGEGGLGYRRWRGVGEGRGEGLRLLLRGGLWVSWWEGVDAGGSG